MSNVLEGKFKEDLSCRQFHQNNELVNRGTQTAGEIGIQILSEESEEMFA